LRDELLEDFLLPELLEEPELLLLFELVLREDERDLVEDDRCFELLLDLLPELLFLALEEFLFREEDLVELFLAGLVLFLLSERSRLAPDDLPDELLLLLISFGVLARAGLVLFRALAALRASFALAALLYTVLLSGLSLFRLLLLISLDETVRRLESALDRRELSALASVRLRALVLARRLLVIVLLVLAFRRVA